MKYKTFRNIDLPIIALGTWAWGAGINGGKSIFGDTIAKEQLKMVFNEANSKGFTLWDTAPVYGLGNSEKLLGEFSKNQNVIISTKFSPLGVQSKFALSTSLKKSCKRLLRENIEIYWVHTPNNVKKWTEALIPLIKEKRIGIVGVSNHNLEQIKEVKFILENAGLELGAVQNHYSIIYRNEVNSNILQYCIRESILFFSYMVLEQGALTGIYTEKNPFPEKSRRGKAFPPEVLGKLSPLHEAVKSLAKQYKVSEAAILIAWAISKNTIPIIGVTKTHHITSMEQAISLNLSDKDINTLEKIADSTRISIRASWE